MLAITRGALTLLFALPMIILAPVKAPPQIFTIKNAKLKRTKK